MMDAGTFTEKYKEIYKDMYRFALCMMRQPHDAEDAVMEAVLLAYENVRNAFFILSEEEQMIVALSVFGGYKSPEIAKILKLKSGTVRSKLSRALDKMECVLK